MRLSHFSSTKSVSVSLTITARSVEFAKALYGGGYRRNRRAFVHHVQFGGPNSIAKSFNEVVEPMRTGGCRKNARPGFNAALTTSRPRPLALPVTNQTLDIRDSKASLFPNECGDLLISLVDSPRLSGTTCVYCVAYHHGGDTLVSTECIELGTLAPAL